MVNWATHQATVLKQVLLFILPLYTTLIFHNLLQADVEISFEVTEFSKAIVLNPRWTNPQVLCSKKGASVKGGLGPFGLLVLASKGLQEYTAVFYSIFRSKNKYVVLLCSDQSRFLYLSQASITCQTSNLLTPFWFLWVFTV